MMKKKSPWKKAISKILVPVTQRYLRKERTTRFGGLTLHVSPGVFHPGLFFSTTTFLHFLNKTSISGKNILEIGCGSGALTLVMQKAGARVTGCDINEEAVKCTRQNARLNGLAPLIYQSDLFENIPPQKFEMIINNPPFYPRHPQNAAEHAWYAGEGHDYFFRLFRDARSYITGDGHLWLVLSDECDDTKISEIAATYHWAPQKVYTRQTLMEKNFIIRYSPV